MSPRYIIVTLDEAAHLATLPGAPPAFVARMAAETGADMRDICAQITALPTCAACNIEGQASSCGVLGAQRLGRRLRRLVERADVP